MAANAVLWPIMSVPPLQRSLKAPAALYVFTQLERRIGRCPIRRKGASISQMNGVRSLYHATRRPAALERLRRHLLQRRSSTLRNHKKNKWNTMFALFDSWSEVLVC